MIPNMVIEGWLVFKTSKYRHKTLWLAFKISKYSHKDSDWNVENPVWTSLELYSNMRRTNMKKPQFKKRIWRKRVWKTTNLKREYEAYKLFIALDD